MIGDMIAANGVELHPKRPHSLSVSISITILPLLLSRLVLFTGVVYLTEAGLGTCGLVTVLIFPLETDYD